MLKHHWLQLILIFLASLVQAINQPDFSSSSYPYEIDAPPAIEQQKSNDNINLKGNVPRRLCVQDTIEASDFEKFQDCEIIVGTIYITKAYWDSAESNNDTQFTSLPNLVELNGIINVFGNSGLQSLGQLFPNLATIRVPGFVPSSSKVERAIYASDNEG